MGCDSAQGYYFSRAAIAAYIGDFRREPDEAGRQTALLMACPGRTEQTDVLVRG